MLRSLSTTVVALALLSSPLFAAAVRPVTEQSRPTSSHSNTDSDTSKEGPSGINFGTGPGGAKENSDINFGTGPGGISENSDINFGPGPNNLR